MSEATPEAVRLDAKKVFTEPNRSEIFSIVAPLFRAVNNQQGAVIALKSGDEAAYDAKMVIVSDQLDAALNALTDFLGGKA